MNPSEFKEIAGSPQYVPLNRHLTSGAEKTQVFLALFA
jgi:hypothetical protein